MADRTGHPTYTAAQLAAIRAKNKAGLALFTLTETATHRFCSGAHAVIDPDAANRFEAKSMKINALPLAGVEASWSIAVEDADRTLYDACLAHSTRLSTCAVDFRVYFKDLDDSSADWTKVVDRDWTVQECEYDTETGWMMFRLAGIAGSRQRKGLLRGNRTDFPNAPDPSEPFRFQNLVVTFQAGPRDYVPEPQERLMRAEGNVVAVNLMPIEDAMVTPTTGPAAHPTPETM